jgi:hypothetical protein
MPSGWPLLFAGTRCVMILFEDIQRVPVVVFHAHSAENRSHRSRCASLLPDHLPYIGGCNPEPKHGALVAFHRLYQHGFRNIDERPRDLIDQFPHVIGSFCCLLHSAPQAEDTRRSASGAARILP